MKMNRIILLIGLFLILFCSIVFEGFSDNAEEGFQLPRQIISSAGGTVSHNYYTVLTSMGYFLSDKMTSLGPSDPALGNGLVVYPGFAVNIPKQVQPGNSALIVIHWDGRAGDFASFEVSGVVATLEGETFKSGAIPLIEGDNIIEVVAQGNKGNILVEPFKVSLTKNEDADFSLTIPPDFRLNQEPSAIISVTATLNPPNQALSSSEAQDQSQDPFTIDVAIEFENALAADSKGDSLAPKINLPKKDTQDLKPNSENNILSLDKSQTPKLEASK